MDCEPEELQFLGIAGICREASTLLVRWRRLFAKIAGTLVLPLSLLFLAHVAISHALFSAIDSDDASLDSSAPGSQDESTALRRLFAHWSYFLLFKAVYLLALLVLALLSTAAVVYTVASIYTAKDLTFSKVLAVVPKVWRRLMVTFLWAFLILLAFNSLAVVIIILVLLLAGDGNAGLALVIFVLVPIYLVGLVWISLVWHLASVVSVLEDVQGLDAMRKSKGLIKGKLAVTVAIFVLLNFCFGAVEFGFRKLVVERGALGLASRFLFGGLMLALLCGVILLALVVQTVVYFVCKSYHHESIDKSSLSDHLEVYLGEYVPLKAKDVQLEQFHV